MSFAVNQLIGFGARRAAGGGVVTIIPGATGTSVGDLTNNGGLAAVFNDNTTQNFSSSGKAPSTAGRGHAGKNWSSAKTITRYVAYSPSDLGFDGNAAHTFTISLYGSNSAPSAWTGTDFGGTQLATTSGIAYGNATVHDKTTGITTTTAYDYHWLMFVASAGSANIYVAEIDFYETI